MTPLASVAMLEKLALLKIALCSAPALSSVSFSSLRAVLSAGSGTPTRVFALRTPMVMTPSRSTGAHAAMWRDLEIQNLRLERIFNGRIKPSYVHIF